MTAHCIQRNMMLRVNQGRRLMMVKKGDRVGAIQRFEIVPSKDISKIQIAL
jgi:hypothetical protein